MRARLLAGFLVFAVAVTACLEIPLGISMQAHQRAAVLHGLERDGASLSVLLADALDHGERNRAAELAARYARATGRDVAVIRAGRVFVASGFAARHEATDSALRLVLEVARLRRVSGETSARGSAGSQFYVALPLPRYGGTHGRIADARVLLMTLPASFIGTEIRKDWLLLALFGLGVLIVATALGLVISGSLIRPLRRIESAVYDIGGGSLHSRAPTDNGPPELRRLARTVNSTAARLTGLLEAQQSFVADASHQLRTPLTALKLRLENLERSNGRDEAADLASALGEVSRLCRVVEALLALARSEGEHPVLVAIDVGAVVQERLHAWEPFAEEQHLTLTASVRPEWSALKVLASPEALEQVLDNLLANAFEATPQGGAVQILAQPADQFVEIHVLDSGPGLEAIERERAFDRFWRGRTAGPDGSGLGLAIVDQLVRLSGGSAELREAAGGGLDAMVRLPTA